MKIQELTIYTNQLEKQQQFYAEILGLTILENSPDSALFQIGNSNLRLIKKEKSTPYHFAFNIPSNKEKEALVWLKERVEVLKIEDKEIQDFDSWNAKAIYFYDPDHNIVEFIVRKKLDNESTNKFDSNSLLEISEIGVPTADIKKEYTYLNNQLNLPIYDGGFERFCALGTETGLFIFINKTIKGWFPLNDKAYSSDFKLKFSVREKFFEVEYVEERMRVMNTSL